MSASSRELEANPETQNGSILEQTDTQGSRERFPEGNKSGKGKNTVKSRESSLEEMPSLRGIEKDRPAKKTQE